jgi:hypothetical protein
MKKDYKYGVHKGYFDAFFQYYMYVHGKSNFEHEYHSKFVKKFENISWLKKLKFENLILQFL